MIEQISSLYATEITTTYLSQYQSTRSRELFGDVTEGVVAKHPRYLDLGFEAIVRVSVSYPRWSHLESGEISIPAEFWIATQAHLEFEQYLSRQSLQLIASPFSDFESRSVRRGAFRTA